VRENVRTTHITECSSLQHIAPATGCGAEWW
jgi:hypothetical protein